MSCHVMSFKKCSGWLLWDPIVVVYEENDCKITTSLYLVAILIIVNHVDWSYMHSQGCIIALSMYVFTLCKLKTFGSNQWSHQKITSNFQPITRTNPFLHLYGKGTLTYPYLKKEKKRIYIYIFIYLAIIPRGRAGYEMIYNQRGAYRRVGYDHFISSKPE